MRVDQTKCDRCGFAQTNPTDFIGQAVVRLKRPNKDAAIDTTPDLCVQCFEVVQDAIKAAMVQP